VSGPDIATAPNICNPQRWLLSWRLDRAAGPAGSGEDSTGWNAQLAWTCLGGAHPPTSPLCPRRRVTSSHFSLHDALTLLPTSVAARRGASPSPSSPSTHPFPISKPKLIPRTGTRNIPGTSQSPHVHYSAHNSPSLSTFCPLCKANEW
jgi:hypothetical protein